MCRKTKKITENTIKNWLKRWNEILVQEAEESETYYLETIKNLEQRIKTSREI